MGSMRAIGVPVKRGLIEAYCNVNLGDDILVSMLVN